MVLCPEDLSSRHGSHLVKFCLTLIVLPSLPHPPHNRIKTYAPLPPTSTSTIPSTRTSTHPTPSAPGTLTSLPSPRPTAVDPSMAIINVSRPLPCEEKGIQIGLGVIAPCLFVSVCLNCFLYVRLKKSESAILFERFRRSMRQGEGDRLIDNDDDEDRPIYRRSTYERSGIRSARTQSLIRPSGGGQCNPIFDSYSESSL